jgi:uncharacterized membrane protein YdjX (TVP38/TMEM64 family)
MAGWLKIVLLIVVVGGSLVLGWQVDFERILNPGHLAEMLQSLGPWGPLVLIGSMATAVVIPPIPSLPLDLASGAAFGPLFGTLYAVIGAAIGAILSFLIGRALGREGISRLFKVDAVFCEKCSDHHIGLLVFFARLLPIVSFDVVSYGAGFTTISLRNYSLATIAGMIPPTFAFAYLGSSVVSAQWVLIGASLLLVAVIVLLPKWLKRNRSSRLAQLFFGPVPPSMVAPDRPISHQVCPACGGSVSPLILPTKPATAAPSGLPLHRAMTG